MGAGECHVSGEEGPIPARGGARTGLLDTGGQKAKQTKWAEKKGDGFLGKIYYTDTDPLGNKTRNGLGIRDMAPVSMCHPPARGSLS